MGLFSFSKDAGATLFTESKGAAEKTQLILAHLKKYDLIPDDMTAAFEGDKLVIAGEARSIQEKRKILATAGNIKGISEVEDRITVAGQTATSEWGAEKSAPIASAARAGNVPPNKHFYTVKKGDYLSKISKEVYGDANKYPIIFEANKPMLKDPDLIYSGQVLVIPELA